MRTGATKALHSVEDACDILSLGRSSLYQELRAGAIESVKARGRTLIPQQSIDQYIERKLAEARAQRGVE